MVRIDEDLQGAVGQLHSQSAAATAVASRMAHTAVAGSAGVTG